MYQCVVDDVEPGFDGQLDFFKDLLSDGGISKIIKQDGKYVFEIKDIPYASLEIRKNSTCICFKKPENMNNLLDKLSHYKELRSPENWLEICYGSDEGIEAILHAELGSFIGQTIFEQNSSGNRNEVLNSIRRLFR